MTWNVAPGLVPRAASVSLSLSILALSLQSLPKREGSVGGAQTVTSINCFDVSNRVRRLHMDGEVSVEARQEDVHARETDEENNEAGSNVSV